jgi:hypothetical protein
MTEDDYMHVVITGSRDWTPDKAHLIWEALKKIEDAHEMDWHYRPLVLHHGECPYGGADLIAASWATGAGWGVEAHPPVEQKGWAYAKRNKEMIDLKPDYVVACFLEGAGNRGTQMTYDMAVAAGLKDRIVEVRA